MNDTEAELREQFHAAVESAEYPVESRGEIVAALPRGMLTRFETGEFSMSVATIAAKLYQHQDFPYVTPEALVEDLIEGLRAENLL